MKNYIHPLSDVKSKNIGNDSHVWQFTIIFQDAVIGENCNINSHCFIESKVRIGDNVTFKCGVYLWDGITMEENAFIGPNVTFMNNHCPRLKNKQFALQKTTVSKGASIGAGATILKELTIGQNALIGTGSVGTHDVPSYSLWHGNPAQQRGFVNQKGLSLRLMQTSGHENRNINNKPQFGNL